MSSVCILTDSAAQFPQLGFAGRNHVRVIAYSVKIGGQMIEEGQNYKPTDLPATATAALAPQLVAPSVQNFTEMFLNLAQYYQEILVLLSSSLLTKAFEHAHQAELDVQGRAKVIVIDTQTSSVGLGLLVQTAAEYVSQGLKALEIEKFLRGMIPHTYMLVCTPSLSYLHYSGIIDESQAFVGEMLGLMPIFVLEEGQVSAVEKVRNSRSLVDFIQEFILEFENLLHIAFIQGTPGMAHEARLIRELVQNNYAQTPFSEHSINLALATLIGPRSISLVIVEKPDLPNRGY